MAKIGIIICDRYRTCAGGKCFKSIKERVGGFSIYPKSENIEVVGYTTCGGCPGGNIEYTPEEMIKNGAEIIHLATGFVVGYPPCPNIKQFVDFIKVHYNIPVIVGTHPIPEKYLKDHEKLAYWEEMNMKELAPFLFKDDLATMKSYD